jgi:hypothetical protein
MERRRFLLGSMGVAGAAVLAACTSGSTDGATPATTPSAGGSGGVGPDGVLAAPGTPGLVDEALYQARIDEYLAVVNAEFVPESATSIGAQLIAAHRNPDFVWDPAAVTVDGLAREWERIDTLQDTRDFQLMYLHWVRALADGSSPMTTLDPAFIEAIDQRMIDNRYRYDDPLPADRVDELWFWSENHIIIGLVNEYLAGMAFPDTVFTVTGLTGAEHAERSRQPILDWVDERARFGFFEWHSHVYMKKNVAPLLTLLEFADDPELVKAATMALDLCVLDMAAHCHNGTYTASRGRTYAKDKLTEKESTFDVFKLLFADTDLAYNEGADTGATYFAGATRYRPPQVLLDIATGSTPGVVRERHGIFVDGKDPITENPEAPFGYDFDDPANLSFWWSQGAVGLWQLTDVSLAAAEEHRLFESEQLAQIKALVDLNGGDPERVKEWVHANHDIVNFGHLREANSYGWRNDQVSLSTVLDHRFGQMRDQIHTWQAAVAPGALVFTTHPVTDIPESDSWSDDAKPGYWTGEASIPRSAQHERTGISIYQPSWDETTDDLLWGIFGYRDFTHAYVPQDRFDQVVRDGGWTFAAKDDGYIALWSWRTPEWRPSDPAVNPTDGQTQPFDLVAPGGPDNVWIVEVGDAEESGSFEDFMAGITASEPVVERDDEGFTVAWTSPTSGAVTFGSTDPFTVEGEEVAIDEFPRHESDWGTVDRLSTSFDLRDDEAWLELDFESGSRSVGAS